MVNITVDLRVWDQFYARWRPIEKVKSARFTKYGDWTLDTGELTLDMDHELSPVFQYVRVSPAPVTMRINGERWDGRIQAAKKDTVSGEWKLTLVGDKKHFYRLQALDPRQGGQSKNGNIILSGTLSDVTARLVASASGMTGLPTYVTFEAEGPKVELEAKPGDYVGDVLGEATSVSDLFVDAGVMLPEDEIPAQGVQFTCGVEEQSWIDGMLAAGYWPHAKESPLIQRTLTNGDGSVVTPPVSFEASGPLDHLGRPRTGTETGISWNAFDVTGTAGMADGGEYYSDPTKFVSSTTRTATWDNLAALAATTERKMFGVFVTEWAAFEWKKGREHAAALRAAEVGLLRDASGKQIKTQADLAAFTADAGDGRVYAWQNGAMWVLATAAMWQVEYTKLSRADLPRLVPGVRLRLHKGRDRRGVVLSTAPGGGLEGFSVEHSGPDAAEVVAAAQWDQWMGDIMRGAAGANGVALSEETRRGLQERVTALEAASGSIEGAEEVLAGTQNLLQLFGANPATGTKATPSDGAVGGVTSVTVDVNPQKTLPGSSVSLGTVAGQTDFATAGVLFYRQKFVSMQSGSTTAAPAAAFQNEWLDAQGKSNLELTPVDSEVAVLGDDALRGDGSTVPGWRIGDRISVFDQGVTISELINGWEVRFGAGQPLQCVPLLGRKVEATTEVGKLVQQAVGAARTAQKTLVVPPARGTIEDIENVVDNLIDLTAFHEEVDAALKAAAAAREEGYQHVAAAQAEAQKAVTAAGNALSEAERAKELADRADAVLDQIAPMQEEVAANLAEVRVLSAQIKVDVALGRSYVASSLAHAALAVQSADEADRLVVESRTLNTQAGVYVQQAQQAVKDGAVHVQNAQAEVVKATTAATNAQAAAAEALRLVGLSEAETAKAQQAASSAASALTSSQSVLSTVQGVGSDVTAKHTQILTMHQEVLEKHQESINALAQANIYQDQAIRAVASGVAWAAQAAMHAGQAADEAAKAADKALDAAAANAAATELLRQANLKQDEAIAAAADAGRQAGYAAADAGKAADSALAATEKLEASQAILADNQKIQSDMIAKLAETNRLQNDAIRAVASGVAWAAQAAMHSGQAADEASRAAKSALDASGQNSIAIAKLAEAQKLLEDATSKATQIATDAKTASAAATQSSAEAKVALDAKTLTIQALEDTQLIHGNAIFWQEVHRTRTFTKYNVTTVDTYSDVMTITPVDSQRKMQLDFPGKWAGNVMIMSRMTDAFGNNSRVDFANYRVGPGYRSYLVEPEVVNYGVRQMHIIIEQWWPNSPMEFVLLPSGSGWVKPPYESSVAGGVNLDLLHKGVVLLLWVRGVGYRASQPVQCSTDDGVTWKTYSAGEMLPKDVFTASGFGVTSVRPAPGVSRPVRFVEQL